MPFQRTKFARAYSAAAATGTCYGGPQRLSRGHGTNPQSRNPNNCNGRLLNLRALAGLRLADAVQRLRSCASTVARFTRHCDEFGLWAGTLIFAAGPNLGGRLEAEDDVVHIQHLGSTLARLRVHILWFRVSPRVQPGG